MPTVKKSTGSSINKRKVSLAPKGKVTNFTKKPESGRRRKKV
jgi:hypothetical protein